MTEANGPEAAVSDEGRHEPPPPKEPLAPNDGKNIAIGISEAGSEGRWARIPIQTELFARGDDLVSKIYSYVEKIVRLAEQEDRFATGLAAGWYVVVSEKIVAISQGRSYFTWEINPSVSAKVLAKFVQRTPHGIGLGSPWTMQLAINEAGLPRILLASGASVIGKLLGRRGTFYKVAGHRVNAIDGPTSYSAYPSNVSAKLPPKDPDQVSTTLLSALREKLPDSVASTLRGVVVIDSNDLGRDVLGQDTDRPISFFCDLFADNPFGQGRQQTPLAICLPLADDDTDAGSPAAPAGADSEEETPRAADSLTGKGASTDSSDSSDLS